MHVAPEHPLIFQHISKMGIPMLELPKWLGSLSSSERVAIEADRSLWRLPYQRPPEGDWRRWIFRAGRGTGKTYTGGDMTNSVAADRNKMGSSGEIGIIGRTWTEARQVMVEGPSGILETAPRGMVPEWEPGNGVLTWPFTNKAGKPVKGRIFSADKPEQMRGPNFSWVWADEPAHWPNFKKTWLEVIELALRSGWARAMLTSTPIPDSFLQELEKMPGSVVTRASTFQNSYLPSNVREAYRVAYEGTRRGDQELGGEYLDDNEKALWNTEDFDQHRVREAPELKRVIVAIDPAVTANENSDETGIIIAGLGGDDHGYVMRDRSGVYTPGEWARIAVAEYYRHKADAIVAEVNNGGDMVADNIRGVDKHVNVISVRASRGKFTRAEPVAALCERGKYHHVGRLKLLEKQCCSWDPTKRDSPDRLDAVVWAITELMLRDDDKAGPLAGYL